MSIEIIGPKAYEFQDRVCVLLAVLAAGDEAIELLIEPAGGEDARLVLKKHGVRHVVEVQAKREKGDIGVGQLVDWLAHFPNRKAEGSLLETLITESSRSILFVTSGRCTDATTPHLVPIGVDRTSLESGKVKDATESTVRSELISYAAVVSNSDGATDKRRRVHIGNTIPKVKTSQLKSALQRVMIVERLMDAELVKGIRDVIQSTHRVVPDHAERVAHAIEEIIVREKRTEVNVLWNGQAKQSDPNFWQKFAIGATLPRQDEPGHTIRMEWPEAEGRLNHFVQRFIRHQPLPRGLKHLMLRHCGDFRNDLPPCLVPGAMCTDVVDDGMVPGEHIDAGT